MQRYNQLQASVNVFPSSNQIHFKYFIIILTLFIATWLTSVIAAVKMVSVLDVMLTGGFIIFPFTTLFGCVIVEVYGYKNARQAIWPGLLLNLTFILFIYLINLIPASPQWKLSKEFENILLPSLRISASSCISFIIAEFILSMILFLIMFTLNMEYEKIFHYLSKLPWSKIKMYPMLNRW